MENTWSRIIILIIIITNTRYAKPCTKSSIWTNSFNEVQKLAGGHVARESFLSDLKFMPLTTSDPVSQGMVRLVPIKVWHPRRPAPTDETLWVQTQESTSETSRHFQTTGLNSESSLSASRHLCQVDGSRKVTAQGKDTGGAAALAPGPRTGTDACLGTVLATCPLYSTQPEL